MTDHIIRFVFRDVPALVVIVTWMWMGVVWLAVAP